MYQAQQPMQSAAQEVFNRKRRMSNCPEYQSAKYSAAQLDDDEAAVPSGKSDFLSPNSRNALLEALVQTQSESDTMPQLRRADPGSSRAQVFKVPIQDRKPEFGDEPLVQWDVSKCHILRKDKMAFVTGITAMLTTWLDGIKAAPFASVFNGKASVPLAEFISTLVDLVDHLRCGRETLLMTVVYVRRSDSATFPVSWNNIFRLLLAGVLTAVKMHDDYGLPNRRYARLIGLEVNDIISLEEHFIRQLNYELYINEPEFVGICTLVDQFC